MSYIHALGVEDPTAILTGISFESLHKRATLFRLLLKLQTLFYELIQSEQDRKTCIGLLSDSVDPDAHPALTGVHYQYGLVGCSTFIYVTE